MKIDKPFFVKATGYTHGVKNAGWLEYDAQSGMCCIAEDPREECSLATGFRTFREAMSHRQAANVVASDLWNASRVRVEIERLHSDGRLETVKAKTVKQPRYSKVV